MNAACTLALILLAACELQPPPKKQAEPPPPPPAAQTEAAKPVEAPPAPPPPAAGSGSAAKIEITAPCLEVAAKLAQLFIEVQTDPGAKSNAEQARADMTRKMGEACTVQGWTDEARGCFLAAKTEPDIRTCEKKFPGGKPAAAAPPPAPPKPPAPD